MSQPLTAWEARVLRHARAYKLARERGDADGQLRQVFGVMESLRETDDVAPEPMVQG